MRMPLWKTSLPCFVVCIAGSANCDTSGLIWPWPTPGAWNVHIINNGAGVYPVVVAVNDLDGDGKMDILAGYHGGGEDSSSPPAIIAFFQIDIDHFEVVQLAAGNDLKGIAALAIADMDDDGKHDIIAACAGQLVYLHSPPNSRQSEGWEQTPIAGSTGEVVGRWTDVAIGEIDGQAGPDIIACNKDKDNNDRGRLCWFISPEHPSSGADWKRKVIDDNRKGAASIALDNADHDQEGRIDAIYSAAPGVYPSSRVARYDVPEDPTAAAGSWQKQDVGSLAGVNRIVLGDLNGDGRTDVIAASPGVDQAGGQVGWYIQPEKQTDPEKPPNPWTGYRLAQFATNTPTDVKVADINGDGQLNVVVATMGVGSLRWFTPFDDDLTKQWAEKNVEDFPNYNIGIVALGDIDADDMIDIVAPFQGKTPESDRIAWAMNPGVKRVPPEDVDTRP